MSYISLLDFKMEKIRLILLLLLVFSTKTSANSVQEAYEYLKNDNVDKGLVLLTKLANEGDSYARYSLGVINYYGNHGQNNLIKAESIFLSGCQEYVEPCWRLGQLYKKTNKLELSEKYLLIAAHENNLRAYSDLYYLYSNKKWEGYNAEKANEWFAKLNAADKSNKDDCNKKQNLTRRSSGTSKTQVAP